MSELSNNSKSIVTMYYNKILRTLDEDIKIAGKLNTNNITFRYMNGSAECIVTYKKDNKELLKKKYSMLPVDIMKYIKEMQTRLQNKFGDNSLIESK